MDIQDVTEFDQQFQSGEASREQKIALDHRVTNRSVESLLKMADSENFNDFDSDFRLDNILVLLMVKIMKEHQKNKAKI